MHKGGILTYMLTDHLGSTSLMTNASGVVISETRYTPWGEVRYQAGTTSTGYTYTGQYSNTADFGLMYYNARWYDPYLNHFTQPDTIVPNPYNSQDYARYAYARNNPVKYTDPTGHMADSDTDEAGCSGQGPSCILDMYGSYGDYEGMDDSLRSFVRRHPDYNPADDLDLSDEEKATVSIAMFRVAVQSGSQEDIVSTAGLVSLFSIIVNGVNMSPDDRGGGGGNSSTGRTIPRNLKEQLAMKAVVANPRSGTVLPITMTDSRWLASEGWVKMAQNVNGVEIHYLQNTRTGLFADFKFK